MIDTVHAIVRFCGAYASRIRAAYFFAFLKAMCKNIPVMLAIIAIDRILTGTCTIPFCVVLAGGMLLTLILQALLQTVNDRLQSATGYLVFAEKRLRLGERLRALPMGYFSAGNIGKISSVLSNDMVFIEENSMHLVADVVNDIFSEGIVLAFLTYLHPAIGGTAALFALIAVILAQFMNAGARKNADARQNSTEKMSGAVLEYIDGMQVVRSFATADNEKDEGPEKTETEEIRNDVHGVRRVRAVFADNAKTNLRFEAFLTPWQTVLMVVYGAGMTAVLYMSLVLYERGTLPVSSLIGVLLFLFHIYAPLMHMYQQGTTLMVMRSCLNRILSLFAEETLEDTGTAPVPAVQEKQDVPEVSFRDVSFAYDKEDVLQHISFDMMRGETVALVGASGSGKTTIASVLARFWDIKEGEITLRGTDIRNIPLHDLMGQVSMVFQKVYLFEDTVYNNIAMGRKDATKEEIEEAARRAGCFEFIMKLPYGFDTVIGEGGATLSGGEAQRISIARCILKDAPIVILDEATASVDADNERHIQQALSELCKDKTTLVIAHRLHTIRSADRIVVIDKGHIAESGTHTELIAQDGIYRKMVNVMGESAA